MRTVRLLAVLLVIMFVFAAHAPASHAAEGDTGTTVDGFAWMESAGAEIAITGYAGAGGDISIPATVNDLPVTSIAGSAFASHTEISGIDIPAGVTAIGANAFSACVNLASVVLPSGLQTIGNGAFYETALTTVDIPDSVTSIGNDAFSTCASLASVTLPSGLQSISNGAFWGTALTTVDIPDSVTSIGNDAFSTCPDLASVTLPSGLQTIGNGAFWGTALTSVDIPAGVTSIGNDAFSTCAGLAKVTVRSMTAVFGSRVFDSTAIASDGMYGHAGSTAETYASANDIPFHFLCTVSFETNGGTSVEGVSVVAGDTLSAPAAPTRGGHVFGGWYLDVALTQSATFPITVETDLTLYAKWTALSLTLSPASGHIYTGGRVVITPSVPDGTWSYDETKLSRDGDTFRGLVAGTVRVTYTVGQEAVHADIVITAAELPATGQDLRGVWALGGAGLLTALAAFTLLALVRKRTRGQKTV